jgi:hypothetical protein
MSDRRSGDNSRERMMAIIGVAMACLGLWKAIQRLREVNRS